MNWQCQLNSQLLTWLDNNFTTMKKLSVSELAKLYGYSRQAIYAHINKGNLSKGSDGLIDFVEALRV